MDLQFWTSWSGLGCRWSRAEVLWCGIASKFRHITPIPICHRCQDDHQSVAAVKLSRKQMVYNRARSEKQNFVFSSQASLHSGHFPHSHRNRWSFGHEKAKHMCFCEQSGSLFMLAFFGYSKKDALVLQGSFRDKYSKKIIPGGNRFLTGWCFGPILNDIK